MRFASGARLGAFEILASLSAAGLGEVYRARDTRLDRTVAIKLLPSEVATAPGRRLDRFRHEARAIARITHPNICTLHDVGEDGASWFVSLADAQAAIEAWRIDYNTVRPHSALQNQTPAAFALASAGLAAVSGLP
jgi:serine/threonine protein kinase